MDCGSACLRMIAAFHGKTFSLHELRKRSHIDREGVSLQGISEASESIGYRTMGVKIPFQGERGDTFDLRMAMALPILTTTGATLPLKPRETGVARIITRERRLLARLFDQILSLIHPNP